MKNFLYSLPVIAIMISSIAQAADIKTNDPEVFVEKAANEIVAIIEKNKDNGAKQSELIGLFEKYVDTKWMSRFVLGRSYNSLSDDQKTKYHELYRDYVVYSYIPRFKEYSGEKIRVTGKVNEGGGEYIVKTALKTPKVNGDVLVDYRVVKKDDSFVIRDVVGEGVSLITTQRSDFARPVNSKGVDFFLGILEKKVAALKARN